MSATPRPWDYCAKLSASENHKGFTLRGPAGTAGIIADIIPRDEDGIEGEANANLIVAAVNACARLGIEPAELEATVRALKTSLEWALDELKIALGKGIWERNDWEHYGPIVVAHAALVPFRKEASHDTDG